MSIISSLPGVSAVTDTLRHTASNVHDAVTGVRDSVLDTKDAILGYTEAAAKTAVTAFVATKVVGLAVAAITAPVPTLIGIAILALFADYAASVERDISRSVTDRREARVRDRALALLSRYGTIPRNAIIETDGLSLELDSATGTVTGSIRTGQSGIRDIREMSIDELERAAAASTGDTADVLKSYIGFRRASA